MTFGPYDDTQALYYASYQNGGDMRRITYGGGAPTAAATATPTSGRSPLQVSFGGSGSSDPDRDALTYLWAFGDGTTATTTTPTTTSHTYNNSDGTYTATLRVRDDTGADSAPITLRIEVGGKPAPQIDSPSTSLLFQVGQEITLSDSATDPEDGTLCRTAPSNGSSSCTTTMTTRTLSSSRLSATTSRSPRLRPRTLLWQRTATSR